MGQAVDLVEELDPVGDGRVEALLHTYQRLCGSQSMCKNIISSCLTHSMRPFKLMKSDIVVLLVIPETHVHMAANKMRSYLLHNAW